MLILPNTGLRISILSVYLHTHGSWIRGECEASRWSADFGQTFDFSFKLLTGTDKNDECLQQLWHWKQGDLLKSIVK